TDVGEVPHQRAHQRVVLAVQLSVVEVDETQCPVSCLGPLTRKRFAYRHYSPCASWVIAVSIPYLTARSEKSSAGQRPFSTERTNCCIDSSTSAVAPSAARCAQ